MKSLLDKDFKYTPAAEQGHDYLRQKFKDIFDAQKLARAETASKVKPIIRGKINVRG